LGIGTGTYVGIGTRRPTSMLTVAGTVQSQTGGFKFPDGTVQLTAAASGTQGPPGPQGVQGPPGPPVHTSAFCSSNVDLTVANHSPCTGRTMAFQWVPGGSCYTAGDNGSCSGSGASGPNGQTAGVCAVCIP
jgi:hypothetical protein